MTFKPGNLVAVLAGNIETIAIKSEALTRLRNGLRLVNDQARNRHRFFVRQFPAHGAIQVANGDPAFDIDRSIRLWTHAADDDVIFVANVADNLFENIFKRDQTLQRAILIHDKCEMTAFLSENRSSWSSAAVVSGMNQGSRQISRISRPEVLPLLPTIARNRSLTCRMPTISSWSPRNKGRRVCGLAKALRTIASAGLIGINHGDVLAVDHDLFDGHVFQIQRADQAMAVLRVQALFGMVKVNRPANIIFGGHGIIWLVSRRRCGA